MAYANEEDPKITARNERKHPDTEKLLRQFLSLESGNFARDAYRASEVWCACGRRMNRRGKDGSTVPCEKCAPDAEVEP